MAKLAELWTNSEPERDSVVIDGIEFEIKAPEDLSFDDQITIAKHAKMIDLGFNSPGAEVSGAELRGALLAIARTLLIDREGKLNEILSRMRDMDLVRLFTNFSEGRTFRDLATISKS
jgi:hypothetical protein